MTIAILYESEEWSNIYLRDYIRDKGCEVMFVNFEKAVLNAALIGSLACQQDFSQLIFQRTLENLF